MAEKTEKKDKPEVVQFQMVDPESREVQMYLKEISQLEAQQRSLNTSLIKARMGGSTAFRSAWREAKINGKIPNDIDLPELFDIKTGRLQVDVEGSIITYRIPPEPKAETKAEEKEKPKPKVVRKKKETKPEAKEEALAKKAAELLKNGTIKDIPEIDKTISELVKE